MLLLQGEACVAVDCLPFMYKFSPPLDLLLNQPMSHNANQYVPCRFASVDVDGTLIRSVGDDANKLHKEAFKRAYLQVFELDSHIDKVKHHGGTDPLILMKVLMMCHDIPKETCMERLDDMTAAMITYYEANKSRFALFSAYFFTGTTSTAPIHTFPSFGVHA